MNEDITREDYEFWIKNNLISDKNVEAKLYTEDEIKEKSKMKDSDKRGEISFRFKYNRLLIMVIKELNNAKKHIRKKDFKAADEIYSKIYSNHQKDFSSWDKNFMH